MQKLDDIQKLRAFAIIMVLFSHTGLALPDMLIHGYTGVSLFFVISGYVVTLSIIRRLPGRSTLAGKGAFLRDFYIRRIFRIVPVAAFWVLASIVIATGASRMGGNVWALPWPTEVKWLLSGGYNYFFAARHAPAMFGHYWSLSVEMHFYLVLPILMLVVRDRRVLATVCALGVVAVSTVARAVTPAASVGFLTHTQADAMLMGVLICLLAVSGKKLAFMDAIEERVPALGKNVILLALVGALLWLPSALDGVWAPILRYPVYTILASVVVFLAQRERGWVLGGLRRTGAFFSYLGDRSFSLYVSHPILWVVLYPLIYNRLNLPEWLGTTWQGLWLQLGVMFIAALGVAELSYRFIEMPYIQYGKSLIANLRQKSSQVVPSALPLAEVPKETVEPAVS